MTFLHYVDKVKEDKTQKGNIERKMGMQKELEKETEYDKGSEAYAKLLAQEEREWHEQYDALIARKLEIFDKLLQMHSAESYELIEKLVGDAMTENVAKRNTPYAWIVIFTQIYRAEKNAGEMRTLFDFADNLQDLIAIVQQVKFLLWEIVFLQEKESEQLLRSFVAQYDMQPELLRSLVHISCLEPEAVIERLTEEVGLNL